MKAAAFHILMSFVFLVSSTPAYSLGDYFTKQIRYDDGNGVEGGVSERVDPINVRGQRRLPDPSGAYWGNRSPGSGNGSGGGEPAYGGSGVAAATPGTADVRCSGTESTITSRALIGARTLAGNAALQERFRGNSLGIPIGTYVVTYADGGFQNFVKGYFSTQAVPNEKTLVPGDGNVKPKDCSAQG